MGLIYKFQAGNKLLAVPTVKETTVYTLPEINILGGVYEPSRIKNQNEIIKKQNPKENYSIVDKKLNKIFYYNKNGNIISSEDIISGKSNNDVDKGLSMKDWFKKTGSDNHEEYFKYLESNKYQTTPAGIYEVSGTKNNVATDPSKLGRLINFFRPERAEQIRQNRIRDYGTAEKMLTLKSEYGIGSSKAMHGTANPIRVEAFNTKDADRNMSNGCINLNGETICHNTLKKRSSVYILPEENEELLTPINKDTLKNINPKEILETKKRIKEALISKGLPSDEARINFLASVAEKETKGGRSLNAKLQDYLPDFLAHSKGEFQINAKMFNDYLPENYSGSFEDQVEAVSNFYDKRSDSEPYEIYQKYSGDMNGIYKDKFNNIYNTAKNAYKKGGLLIYKK